MNEWEWELLEGTMPVDRMRLGNTEVGVGDRVRLHPRAQGDVIDAALSGKAGLIESIQQDYEGRLHLCVVLEEDPGQDLGLLRQPAHRFFFAPEELEALQQSEAESPVRTTSILIAGIGNIFLGDDGFGVEVAQRLSRRSWPKGVRVADFGIRGLDLAYALADGYDAIILIDACPRGGKPGTLYTLEPDLAELTAAKEDGAGAVESHGMNPTRVLQMASSLGAQLSHVLVIGCEPATLGPEEGAMGLSPPVEAAVEQAVERIDSLIQAIQSGDWPGMEAP